jgi:hypothetical protein
MTNHLTTRKYKVPSHEDQGVKLPKQWRHWLRINGMKPSHFSRGSTRDFYFGDHQFRFMIGIHNTVTMAKQGGFNRWAVSRLNGIEEPIPKTLAEFSSMLKSMQEQAAVHSRP